MVSEDGEVFFMTSRARLLEACRAWSFATGTGTADENEVNATHWSRQLMQHLQPATQEELEAYASTEASSD